MDRQVTERKLESLRHCVQRLRSRRSATAAQLAADEDLQDLLVLNLSRAVQLCVDLAAHRLSALNKPVPATMGDAFTQLAAPGLLDPGLANRLKRAVGFRKVAVHNYEVMDWDIVHALTGDPLADFDQFAAAM